jgi:hypothetical protein
MIVSEYTKHGIPVLTTDTLLEEVFLEDFSDGLMYAPVVQDGSFLGFLFLEDLDIQKETLKTVGQCQLEKAIHFLKGSQHIFEALPIFLTVGLPVLPVLEEDGGLDGILRLESLMAVFSESYAFQTTGAVLVLSMPAIQYSLSEISRLVEANQAKVLSVLVESDPILNQNFLVHLKINQPDLSRVVATLERFEYNVLEVHQSIEASSIDKERFDQLMRYLGI